jgi:hypothetical protein
VSSNQKKQVGKEDVCTFTTPSRRCRCIKQVLNLFGWRSGLIGSGMARRSSVLTRSQLVSIIQCLCIYTYYVRLKESSFPARTKFPKEASKVTKSVHVRRHRCKRATRGEINWNSVLERAKQQADRKCQMKLDDSWMSWMTAYLRQTGRASYVHHI